MSTLDVEKEIEALETLESSMERVETLLWTTSSHIENLPSGSGAQLILDLEQLNQELASVDRKGRATSSAIPHEVVLKIDSNQSPLLYDRHAYEQVSQQNNNLRGHIMSAEALFQHVDGNLKSWPHLPGSAVFTDKPQLTQESGDPSAIADNQTSEEAKEEPQI